MIIVLAIAAIIVLTIKFSNNLDGISKIILNYSIFEDVILSVAGLVFLVISVIFTKSIYLKKEF